MRMRRIGRLVVIAFLLSFGLLASAAGATVPAVAKQIPRDAVYAFFVSKPGQVLSNLDSILQNFKSISPEIDLKKQGEQLKQEIGENILTPEGLKAFGLDPDGTYVIYGTDTERGPAFALALGTPGVFKQKLIALIKKSSPEFKGKPRIKAGVEILDIEKGYIGFKGSWCLVLPPESVQPGKKDQQLIRFFKPGKSLASDPAFLRTLKNMPDETHALLYLDLRRLVALAFKENQDSLRGTIKSHQKQKTHKDDAKFIQSLQKDLLQMKKLQKTADKALAFIDRVALSWTVNNRSIDSAGFLGATTAGIKTLRDIFPPQVKTPEFHAGLMETSILGAWLSLDQMKLLDNFGWIPLYGDMTLKKTVEQSTRGFKKDTNIDFFKELMGGLAGPGAFYLLQPGQEAADSKADPKQQLTRMIRAALLVQVKNPQKAGSMLKRINKFLGSRGPALETQEVSGASITTMRPEAGLVFSWGLKGNTVFITFGENTAGALAKILPTKAWTQKARSGPVGSGILDFAVLSEAISSAMARGVGGQDAAQFRMMIWPIMQQVLGKMSKIHFSARLEKPGLSTSGSLEFR